MKKYILTNMFKQELSLVAKSGKGEVLLNKRIEFGGGTYGPNRVNGSYYTDSELEIKTIESHPWFGKAFILDPDYKGNMEAKPKAKAAEPAPVAPAPMAEEPETEVESEPEGDSYPDVTTNQQAHAILKTYDATVTTANVRNKAQILAKAAELGVSFPNL